MVGGGDVAQPTCAVVTRVPAHFDRCEHRPDPTGA